MSASVHTGSSLCAPAAPLTSTVKTNPLSGPSRLFRDASTVAAPFAQARQAVTVHAASEGSVAIVTGASRGIGRSIALALGSAGEPGGVSYRT